VHSADSNQLAEVKWLSDSVSGFPLLSALVSDSRSSWQLELDFQWLSGMTLLVLVQDN
jgi:hypothetical protein